MILFLHSMSREKEQAGANKFFVDREVFPQTLDVLRGRASHLKVELVTGDYRTHQFTTRILRSPRAVSE
jgi:glycine dehydrogenase